MRYETAASIVIIDEKSYGIVVDIMNGQNMEHTQRMLISNSEIDLIAKYSEDYKRLVSYIQGYLPYEKIRHLLEVDNA